MLRSVGTILALCLCCALPQSSLSATRRDASVQVPSDVIQGLFDRIAGYQMLEEVPAIPGEQLLKRKGSYSSDVKINLHGSPLQTELRHRIKVYDNNVYNTMWVSIALLESYFYTGKIRPTDEQLDLALDLIYAAQDVNTGYTSSVMGFWAYLYNEESGLTFQVPVNLLETLLPLTEMSLDEIKANLKLVGLGDIAEDVAAVQNFLLIADRLARIPPDFDDTFVNLVLGCMLQLTKDEFPSADAKWKSYNTNITSVYTAAKKYAYRPFSDDRNINTIDTRSYVFLRGFLDQAAEEGTDLAILPTWILNIDEQRDKFKYLMHFLVNDADAGAVSSIVTGTNIGIIGGLLEPEILEDPDLEQIYLNTSSLLAYSLETNFNGRMELAMSYYPSANMFYWWISRILSFTEWAKQEGPLPVPVMETVYEMLKSALMNEMTESVLGSAQVDEEGDIFFVDFLGNNDYDHDNQPTGGGEDRIYSTACAANALMNTWLIFDKATMTSEWRAETPEDVKATVRGSVNWLVKHSLTGDFDAGNAYFAAIVKGHDTEPYWYPANRYETYEEGTPITDLSAVPEGKFIIGVEGYIPKDQYDAMLTQTYFGEPVPSEFSGYADKTFFYWSSEPYTYAITFLALTRYSSIIDE